jgi:SNF2 family DNA or RNA helicase
LISLRAGGVGLNLTAADHVFLLDPWWNPAVEDQAADRAHRIGQERPVLVHRLVAQDTVEERILALQESKRAIASAALDGGAGAELTREDLLALLA